MANAIANAQAFERQIHDGARTFACHDVIMAGFAPDDGAQCHIGIKTACGIGQGDGTGNFQGTGNRNALPCGPSRFNGGNGTARQFIGKLGVEAGFHDEDMGFHPDGLRSFGFRLHDLNSVRRAT